MDNQLIPYNGEQVTPLGSLYMKQEAETLHRVRKFRIHFIGGDTRDITYQQYDSISKLLTSPSIPKFIRFKDTKDIIATNQIASIKSYETIVDTRREDL